MTRTSQASLSIAALCVLIVAACLSVAWIWPPAPLPAEAPATDFSAERAMHNLEVIAREPRPMGISPAHARVRDFLLDEIRALGLEPQVQKTFGERIVHPGYVCGGMVENILVRLPGTNPEGALLLSAHYDSTPGGPGGADNGTGVVTLLEILHGLRANPPLRQDVIGFFTDGEEPCTIGAHAFVAHHPWLTDVRLAINMDQFKQGPPMLLRASPGNGALIQALAHSAASTRPAYLSFPFYLFVAGDTDLTPFLRAGVPGADIASGGPFPETHTALDLPEFVDPRSLQQAGNQLLALVRYLGDQPRLQMNAPDETFFPMLGLLMHYPSSLAWPLAAAAGLCCLGVMVYGFRQKALTWRGLGLGLLAFLFSLALGVVAANLIWRGILALHPEYAYTSFSGYRQKLSGDFLYAVGFIALTLAAAAVSMAVARRRVTACDLAAGALVIWLPLTLAAALLFPATSYLFTWVLLSGSLALLPALAVRARQHWWVPSRLSLLAGAVLATFLWLPLIYFAVLAGPMSPDTPLLSIMVAMVALWLGSMTPALDWITSQKRWLLPVAASSAALGFLVAGHFLTGKASPPPLINPIGYWLDANTGEAFWVAFSDHLDERQADLLGDAVRRPYTALLKEAPQSSVLTSAAPMLDLDGPRLEVLGDAWVADRRVVAVRVTASMHDRVYIIIPNESPLLAITVPNNERTELPGVDGHAWMLRFDGMPVDGIEITLEFPRPDPIQVRLVEEKTGLPSFPGMSTQPEPGTMKSPGDFQQAIPTDFTALNRDFVIPLTDR